jgi:hypothetical protein
MNLGIFGGNQSAYSSSMGGSTADGKYRRILTVGLPIFLVLMLAVWGFSFMSNRNKTSPKSLTDFSTATTNVNTKSTELIKNVTRTTYEDVVDIEGLKKDFDSAFSEYSSATDKIKSDRKDLRSAADDYRATLKEYRDNIVTTAIDYLAIKNVYNKTLSISVNLSATVGNQDTLVSDIDRARGQYVSLSGEFKGLQLTSQKGNELRDSYISIVDQIADITGKLKNAVVAKDTNTIIKLQLELSNIQNNKDVPTKQFEIEDMLGVDSPSRKKVEDARNNLNSQIESAQR